MPHLQGPGMLLPLSSETSAGGTSGCVLTKCPFFMPAAKKTLDCALFGDIASIVGIELAPHNAVSP